MIFLNSRYATSGILSGSPRVAVTRDWSHLPALPPYFLYTWTSGDRVDRAVSRAGIPATAMHRFLDINPDIVDPMMISPGQVVRIPDA